MAYYVERFGPFTVAIATVLVLFYFRADIYKLNDEESLKVAVLYSSIFDWSAIQTGFLFGIFGYVGGKDSGFIGKIKDTPALSLFFSYTKTAIWLGFILTFVSIPLMVTQFAFGNPTGWGYTLFTLWCGLSVWAFFAFMRVAYIFGLLLRPKDRNETSQ